MTLRPYRPDDLTLVGELFDRISVALYGTPEQPISQLELWLSLPEVDPERDVRLAFDGDRLVGYADVEDQQTASWADCRVDLDANLETVAGELLDWAEGRAAREALRVSVPHELPAQARAYEARGYGYIRSSYRMGIDLDGELDAPDAPEGIELRGFEAGDEQAAHATFQDSFADTWDHEPMSFEDFEHVFLRSDSADPSLWVLAWDGAELAGEAICSLREQAGWIHVLAVRRYWRRRGLGGALLRHAFKRFQDRGARRVELGVDAASPTGAQRLYTSAGMTVARQTDLYEKAMGSR